MTQQAKQQLRFWEAVRDAAADEALRGAPLGTTIWRAVVRKKNALDRYREACCMLDNMRDRLGVDTHKIGEWR